MHAVLVNVGEKPVEIDVKNEWQDLRDAIKTEWIEFFYPFSEKVAIVCDEEGKINGSEINRVLHNNGHYIDSIFGNFLIVGLRADDCKSLTQKQIEKYIKQFSSHYVNVN